jgi:hypothetical protein
MANFNTIRYNNPYSAAGNFVKISSATASSDSTISFTSGIDSTYKEYIFYFVNIHPETDGSEFQFNMSVDSGSNYNVTKTTSFFDAEHNEDDSYADIGYQTGQDLAQSTSFQNLSIDMEANDSDGSLNGYLHLFNPSSTTFVKHFIAATTSMHQSARIYTSYIAGYANTASAIDAVQFKMSSGNIDSGTIIMYGVK